MDVFETCKKGIIILIVIFIYAVISGYFNDHEIDLIFYRCLLGIVVMFFVGKTCVHLEEKDELKRQIRCLNDDLRINENKIKNLESKLKYYRIDEVYFIEQQKK